MGYKSKLIDFAHWVANEIMSENCEEDADVFIEIACRKLYKLGIIKKEDNRWVYEYDLEDDE